MTDQITIDAAIHGDASLAISAGAGTGKTHRLTERYCYHLEQGWSPLQIVAVTFTDRAANELRGRIRERVAELLRARPGLFAENALAEIEAAPISTLHGLAARICREHPEDAGVPAEFALLDPIADALWQSDQLDVILDRLPSRVYELVPYELARSAITALLDDPLVAEQALRCSPEDWETLIAAERARSLARLTSDPRWVDATETLTAVIGAASDLLEAQRQVAVGALSALARGELPREPLEALAALKVNAGRQGNWPAGGLAAVKRVMVDIRELAKEVLAEGLVTLELGAADVKLRAMLPALVEAFALVQRHLDEAKRRQRVLTFADLEVHATRALRCSRVRAYYAERWQAFLIDEFQDTNPVQAELVEALLAPSAILTVVGDPKQSIYGFRRADSTVFERFRAKIVERGGHEVRLSTSFRTHVALVHAVNRVSAKLLDRLHQDLEAERTIPPHPGPHLRVYSVDKSEAKVSQEQRRWVEARHLAGLLRGMLDAETLIHVKNSPADECRPIRPGDIAILARSWDTLDRYVDALELHQIPVVLTGGGNLLDTREAKDGIALLRFLADQADDVALAAVLRGPFFAVSDRVLFHFAQLIPKGSSWWDALSQSSGDELVDAQVTLQELVDARRRELPSRLLQLADRRRGYTAVIGNLPNARRCHADWAGLVAFARLLEQENGDVFAVVRQIKRLVESETEVPRPPLQAGDAVALLTIHGAKGLEWPVVIVPDLARRPPSSRPDLYFDPNLGVAMRFPDDDGEAREPMLYTVLRARARRREEEEARRVLYVALTRARDHLILTSSDARGPDLERLAPGFDHADIVTIPVPFDATLARPPDPPDPPLPPEPERWLPEPITLGSNATA